MTNWEGGIELSRAISHLAAANQQLSAAQNLALGHVQCLYAELKRNREKKSRTTCPNCENKESHSKSTGKTKLVLKRQRSVVKPANKSLRQLKKIPAFDESRDIQDDNEDSVRRDLESNLERKIEELNIFKLESQTKNDKLVRDLEQQRLLIERLTQDFKDSQIECERVKEKLSRSELESARLLAKLETFQCERRQETEERRKHLQTLDETTQQIRVLELAIQNNNQTSVTASESPPVVETPVECCNDNELGAANVAEEAVHPLNEQFKKDLMLKREARQRAIAAISSEMERLKQELESERLAHMETTKKLENLKEALAERAANKAKTDNDSKDDLANEKTENKTSDHVEALRLFDLLKISDEVTSNLWLQLERTDDLRFQLENDPDEHRLRINSLKRLAEETRATLRSRKQQTNALKDRLAQLLVRLNGEQRHLLDSESDEIRQEAERQLQDITRSRLLCDERSRILAEFKEHSSKQIHELKLKLSNLGKDNLSLEEDLRKTEDKMEAQDAEILNLESQLGLAKADCRDLQNQMSLINSLFTQMLLSASSAEMDLDRLTQLLQENHDLISGMAKETGTEAAALPKLLLDIIEQVDGRTRESEEKKEEDELQEENIAHNLPKVWRILLELLSCHVTRTGSASADVVESTPDSCYKSVDTPTGPRLVISVSKTYIRLKELILEKKHLEKEMNRMKQLNTHLESKLSEQEKRLGTVSDELSKTWNIVGRMQAQHHQLHTHEKILRYELQQKRKMLQELKQELEYCREKWESARQKNTNTEIEWRSLRKEFAARKALVTHTKPFNNSGESGFSDEREESDEDERGLEKRVRISTRRRSKKDDIRASSLDIESEQPTDTEFSESKTVSSSTSSGQQTPARETDDELENYEVTKEASSSAMTSLLPNEVQNSDEEIVDPLDKALAKVIENLLETNECTRLEESPVAFDSDNAKEEISIDNEENLSSVKQKTLSSNGIGENSNRESSTTKQESNEAFASSNLDKPSQISVFSIGPIPAQILVATNLQFSSNALVPELSSVSLKNSTESNENLSNAITTTTEKEVSPKESTTRSEDDISVFPTSSTVNMPGKSMEKLIPSLTETSTTKGKALEEKPEPERRRTDFQTSEALDARAARLKSLEEAAEWLVKKVSDTNRRGSVLSSRLEELHETYGSTPAAPPMPSVLPTFRLRSELHDNPVEARLNGAAAEQQTNNRDEETKLTEDKEL